MHPLQHFIISTSGSVIDDSGLSITLIMRLWKVIGGGGVVKVKLHTFLTLSLGGTELPESPSGQFAPRK
jgi:hypothetical protein